MKNKKIVMIAKEDITAYEITQLLPFLLGTQQARSIEDYPTSVRRHLVELNTKSVEIKTPPALGVFHALKASYVGRFWEHLFRR